MNCDRDPMRDEVSSPHAPVGQIRRSFRLHVPGASHLRYLAAMKVSVLHRRAKAKARCRKRTPATAKDARIDKAATHRAVRSAGRAEMLHPIRAGGPRLSSDFQPAPATSHGLRLLPWKERSGHLVSRGGGAQ